MGIEGADLSDNFKSNDELNPFRDSLPDSISNLLSKDILKFSSFSISIVIKLIESLSGDSRMATVGRMIGQLKVEPIILFYSTGIIIQKKHF